MSEGEPSPDKAPQSGEPVSHERNGERKARHTSAQKAENRKKRREREREEAAKAETPREPEPVPPQEPEPAPLDDPEADRRQLDAIDAMFGARGASPDADPAVVVSPDIADPGRPDNEPILIGVPSGVQTPDQINNDDSEFNAKPIGERITITQARLDELHDELAKVSAKRGTRMFSKTGGNRKRPYEMVHGEYIRTLHQLTNLQLEDDNELKGIDDEAARNRRAIEKGMTFMDRCQTDLRETTNKLMQGTKVGKLIQWMSKGGKLKKFAKMMLVTGVGVGAAAAGGLFLGAGMAGAIGGGALVLGIRTFRGYLSSESGQGGRSLAEHKYGDISNFDIAGTPVAKFIEQRAVALHSMLNDAVEKRQKKFRGAVYRGVGFAAVGSLAGYGIGYAAENGYLRNPLSLNGNGDPLPPRATGDLPPEGGAPEVAPPEPEVPVNNFAYNSNENPFYMDKLSDHGMGPPLHGDAALDAGKPGWHDLTQNRWANSPHQFSSIVHALGLDNLPDDMQSANALAEEFKINPGLMSETHGRVMELLNDPTTKVETGVPIQNAYSSEWGVDPHFEQTGMRGPASDFQLAWDEHVDPPGENGTKTVITYRDPNPPHGMKTLELREQCGGQRIVEHAAPPPPPEPVYEQPRQVYTQPPVYEEPPNNPPPPDNPPPPNNPPPPVEPPPPVQPPPPVEPPPPPQQPDKPESGNPLPLMPPFFQGPVGPALPNIPEAPPPPAYTPPVPGNSGGLAPGATPGGGLFDGGGPSLPGANPDNGINGGPVGR